VAETATKQVFAIIGIKNEPAIADKLRTLEVKSIALGRGGWLAVYGGTTREFAEALGIRNGEIGALGIVIPVENYSGRAASEIWEWLKVNRPQNG
jgi:hypothetical protein